MVMGKDGQKLSKRHGSTSLRDFREKGYLPEAIINYVTLVGWSLDGSTEFFSREDLEKCFKLENIHKAPAVFDYKKLDWFNGYYIREKAEDELAVLVLPFLQKAGYISQSPDKDELDLVAKLVKPARERMKVLSDIVPLSAFVFEDVPVVQREMYIAKGADLEKTKKALSEGSSISWSCQRLWS